MLGPEAAYTCAVEQMAGRSASYMLQYPGCWVVESYKFVSPYKCMRPLYMHRLSLSLIDTANCPMICINDRYIVSV